MCVTDRNAAEEPAAATRGYLARSASMAVSAVWPSRSSFIVPVRRPLAQARVRGPREVAPQPRESGKGLPIFCQSIPTAGLVSCRTRVRAWSGCCSRTAHGSRSGKRRRVRVRNLPPGRDPGVVDPAALAARVVQLRFEEPDGPECVAESLPIVIYAGTVVDAIRRRSGHRDCGGDGRAVRLGGHL